jgi:flagellar FliL protein
MAKDKEEAEEADAAGGGKKKLVIIFIPILLLLAGAGWFLVLKPDKSGVPEALPEPKPGAVVALDSITLNLAGGHFLKLGMAIQPTASAVEVDGSKALDLAIGEFSQLTITELSTTAGRNRAKAELIARIKLAYLPEGTDLASVSSLSKVTGSDSSDSDSESSDSESSDSESSDSSSKSDEESKHEEVDLEKLTGAQVIKIAASLTVQPEVYNVYFTEFVMQ